MASQQDIANRIPITGALMLATLMNTLDSTIANVALPHIQGSVSASAEEIVWVLTSYIIATAIMTPLSGWLSMKIGRKTMFLASIAGFTLASILCGIATSLPEIVIFRLAQGVAGASLIPLSQTVMLDIYPQRMIPRVMSIWSAAVILGPIIGPTLGGWLTEDFSWRWVFYINVPIGILAFFGIWTFMDRDDGGRERPFDFLGFGALVLFIGGFQLMVDRGPTLDWFDSKEVWFEAAICATGLWVFVVQTITAKHPFFHRDLAKDGNFIGTTIFGMFVGVLLFSTSALLPSMMQTLLGYSAFQAGVASMTRGLGSLIAFLAVPMLVGRFGPRTVLLVGVLLSSLALWQMGQFDLSMTPTPIEIAGFIQGLGTGLLFAPLNTLAYAKLAPIHRTEGTIVSTMARSIGSSAGISVLQALLIRDAATAHAGLTTHITVTNPVLRWALPSMFSLQPGPGLSALNGEVTRQGTMISYDALFSGMAVGCLFLAPTLLFLKPVRAAAPSAHDLVAD
ncbi:DHA2 family efflux MFS transporter permease subunit [Phenylobacterium sp.]|jgi:MFS transporter, DHA2 family, multidrug resistance protein|uniref:DHA2 family efflux MFS transporter permease subunit n=1 Tax=Phenylobacterium sp. TaxID=1871053 RepID=UPI0011FDC51E|nr:DHA2 family efflux MFS transporter permease subunit [Phenylobacterium sp.]THD71115.1 MAG: DHA2 family efflux MFS transporter permease subunit [Phenylobacterium sp.]